MPDTPSALPGTQHPTRLPGRPARLAHKLEHNCTCPRLQHSATITLSIGDPMMGFKWFQGSIFGVLVIVMALPVLLGVRGA